MHKIRKREQNTADEGRDKDSSRLWDPGIGVGDYILGRPLPGDMGNYKEIERESALDDVVYADSSDGLRLYVTNGVLTGIVCNDRFCVGGYNAIGGSLSELERVLGEQHDASDGPWQIGDEEQLAVQFNRLDLQVWVAHGIVRGVFFSVH